MKVIKKMNRKALGFVLLPLLMVACSVTASTEVHLDKAPVDLNDHASIQRGATNFVNYCMTCHSANYMRYNSLLKVGLSEKKIKENFLSAGKKIGDTMKGAMSPADVEKMLGVAPPDLSVEVRARGVDWIYSYMRGFYRDESRPTGWNNTVFDKVAMPHILSGLQGEQILNHETHQLELAKPGSLSVEEYDQLVADLTNYMAFMSEPNKAKRLTMGWFVLGFLVILFVFAYRLKKAYWKDVH